MTRIIAGSLKNRTIPKPQINIRPTQERVKAVLFSVLGDITDMKVVDLFTGSGNLGFEALSRGAAFVTMVDIDSKLIKQIKLTAERLGVAIKMNIIHADAIRFLKNQPEADIILADPPYRYPHTDELLRLMTSLKNRAVVLETDKFYQMPDDYRSMITNTKKIGDTVLYFFGLP